MKQRAIKRCIKRTQKKVIRGTYRGRKAVLAPNMAGAIMVSASTYSTSVLQPQANDCRWAFCNGERLNDGHAHWLYRGYYMPVAVSYAGR